MNFAATMKERGYDYAGGRSRMPVYPFIQTFVYQGVVDDAFFFRGKLVNSVLSYLVLAVSFLIFNRYMPVVESFLGIAVVALTVFAYKAPYFQAEVLYYGLFFGFFVALLELCRAPRWRLAIVAGCLGALTYLTKASALPLLLIACGCLCLWSIWGYAHQRIYTQTTPGIPWPTKQSIISVVLLVASFLTVLSPYLLNNKEKYGRYFYNVPSTFYIWYDSKKEVKSGTKAYGDREGWPRMPDDQIPSMGKYFETHSSEEILSRIGYGFVVHKRNLVGYKIHQYLGGYFIFAVLIIIMNRRRFWSDVHQPRIVIPLLFAVGCVTSYALLYAFYSVLTSGARFLLALVLPVVFLCSMLSSRPFLKSLPWPGIFMDRYRKSVGTILSWLMMTTVAAWLMYTVVFHYAITIGERYSGF